jgi:hypothetical protein
VADDAGHAPELHDCQVGDAAVSAASLRGGEAVRPGELHPALLVVPKTPKNEKL